MDLENFRILIHEPLNKDTDIVPDTAPLIMLDSKSAMCIVKNGRDNKHNRHIARRVSFVRNGENCKLHKIDWCEGDLQLAEIATKNFGENDLNPRMKHIMVRLEN